MSSILADPIAPSYMSPNAGEGVAGPQPMSPTVQYTGAQINFGDLTPYFTYIWSFFFNLLDFELKHLRRSVLQALKLRSFFNLYYVMSLVSTFKILR